MSKPLFEPKTVVAAAIRDCFGGIHFVPRPGRHNDVIAHMVNKGIPLPVTAQCEQGFVLSDGRFVMRKAAGRIALRAGQCEKLRCPGVGLFSEDVW